MELKTIKPTIEVYNSTLATILSYQKDILLSTYSIGAPLSDFKEEYISFVTSLIPIWHKEGLGTNVMGIIYWYFVRN